MANAEATKELAAEHPWWVPIWEFLVHTVVGTILFLLIAVPAVGLSLLIDAAQAYLYGKQVVVLALTAVEYLILASDLFLFVVFIVRSVGRAIRAL